LFEHYGVLPTLIWAGTFVMVITTDLLMGVLVGMGLSLLELIPHLRKLKLDIHHHETNSPHNELELTGSATFVQLPRLSKALESLPAEGPVRLTLARLSHIDHTCAEMIKDWLARHRAAGRDVSIDPAGAARHQGLAAAH
jgi:MFS superfamily sulfate permease-like transporter